MIHIHEMEEVDRIIIQTFRNIGCDINDDIDSVSSFSSSLIVEAVSKCCQLISGDENLPKVLPPSMATRFRIGTKLSDAIKNIGYKGDIGYQTLLYSNDIEIRRVFMFLIEKLPKESSIANDQKLNSLDELKEAVAVDIQNQVNIPWIPNFLRKQNIYWFENKWHKQGCSYNHIFHAEKLFFSQINNDIHTVSRQLSDVRNLSASLLELNGTLLINEKIYDPILTKSLNRQPIKRVNNIVGDIFKKSIKETELIALRNDNISNFHSISTPLSLSDTFVPNEKTTLDKVVKEKSPSEHLKTHDEELVELEDQLHNISNNMKELELQCKKFNKLMPKVKRKTEKYNIEIENKRQEMILKTTVIALLPDATNNITKLQLSIKNQKELYDSIQNELEKEKSELQVQLLNLQEGSQHSMSEADEKCQELERMDSNLKEIIRELSSKEDLKKQLVIQVEKLSEQLNRSAYTRRIMEIVSNIKKQKAEIDKVLIDTKQVQKEVNNINGKLDRTFNVTDELIFRDAKKDETARKSYKYLASLHENCGIILKTLEDTSIIIREIRTLDDQIDLKCQEKVGENLEKILNDYNELKKENIEMRKRFENRN